MSIAKVRSQWENGDLVFYDLAGTEIARFDESAATLDITKLAIGSTAVSATAEEINLLHGSGAAVASGTQAAVIADPSGGATTDAEARTAINAIIDALQAFGIVATE